MRFLLALLALVAVASAFIPVQQATIKCTVCEEVVKVAEQFITEDKSVIEQEVNKVCDTLPFMQDMCKQYVDQYLDQVIQELQNGANAEQVCQKIHLC